MSDVELNSPPVPQTPPPSESGELPFALSFRAVKENDLNFVLSSWLKSHRDVKRTMKNPAYFTGQQKLIAALAQKRNMVIGCDADAPDWIVGFACGTMLEDGRILIDYVYVKQPYRMRGVGKALVAALGWHPEMGVVATHWNTLCKLLNARYNLEHDEYYLMLGADE